MAKLIAYFSRAGENYFKSNRFIHILTIIKNAWRRRETRCKATRARS